MIRSDLERALSSLRVHKVRALLTVLGVLISAGSFVLLVALVQGGKQALGQLEQQANESDLITIEQRPTAPRDRQRTQRRLARTDAAVLSGSRSLEEAWIGTEQGRESDALFQTHTKRVTISSVAPDALGLYRLQLETGRFISADDLEALRFVCVVGHEVWTELLRANLPAGAGLAASQLTIDGRVWSVIGVLGNKPGMDVGMATNVWNRKVLVPATTFDAVYDPGHSVRKVLVRAPVGPDVGLHSFEQIVEGTLSRLHYGVRNFGIASKEGREQGELIVLVVQILLLGTAVVSLTVGGINVMNVMLVAVTERTREIGIRRALGAPARAIRRQFLIEATLLTTLGGLAGVLLGALGAWLGAVILRQVVGHWALCIEPWAVLVGFALSVATGIVFGSYPARRAARVDVVVALRGE
jgi:putative ABC transport system permease protein